MQKPEGLGIAEAQVPEKEAPDPKQETFAEGSNPKVRSQPNSHFVCLKHLADVELNRGHFRLKKIETGAMRKSAKFVLRRLTFPHLYSPNLQ